MSHMCVHVELISHICINKSTAVFTPQASCSEICGHACIKAGVCSTAATVATETTREPTRMRLPNSTIQPVKVVIKVKKKVNVHTSNV